MSDDEAPMHVDLAVSGHSYGHSKLNWSGSLDPRPFSEEELALGRAVRFVFITEGEAWRYSTCLDCGAPLPFHPRGRRRRNRKRYCNIAQKKMFAALDTQPPAEECPTCEEERG